MGKYRGLDDTEAWVSREIAALWAAIKRERSAKRLPGSSFAGVNVPNSSLETPSAPGSVNQTVTNFAVAAAGGNLINATVSVPNGFTSAVVSLTGRVYAANGTGSLDYLYCRPVVNGTTGNAVPVSTPAGESRMNVGTVAAVVTGLGAGGSFSVQLWASTSVAAWAANANNTADLVGSIVWFS